MAITVAAWRAGVHREAGSLRLGTEPRLCLHDLRRTLLVAIERQRIRARDGLSGGYPKAAIRKALRELKRRRPLAVQHRPKNPWVSSNGLRSIRSLTIAASEPPAARSGGAGCRLLPATPWS